jgi:hypothetical protein
MKFIVFIEVMLHLPAFGPDPATSALIRIQ